ncbi:MAG: TolC family protein [Sandaracinaceae bacterium]|nr:TolC family protein [Sandaracinaceae bacterium]
MPSRLLAPSLLAALVLGPAVAHAQQPLTEFLASADTEALDLREARATLRQTRAQVDAARARLLPAVQGQATYTRNDPVVEVTIPTGMVDAMGNPVTRQASITPADQFAATATLNVPLLDLSAWAGFFQAEAAADAVDATVDTARRGVEIAVVQRWHQLVAQRALIGAAQRNLEVAERGHSVVAARFEVGVASQLELSRAEAEVARARQAVAEAELAATLAARGLQDLTGLEPSPAVVALEDDLHAEQPLATFTANIDDLPAVRAARQQQRAASIARDGAWFALLPTLGATAVARWSNASGFGRQDSYYLGLSATWAFDFSRPAQVEATSAALEGVEVREDRALQQARTAVFEAWHRVDASRASAAAADSVLAASRRAAEDAAARNDSGVATQLERIQAERDLFQAEVGRIQAIANLRVAREVLRIQSGLER